MNDMTKTPSAELVREFKTWVDCPRRFNFTQCGDCGKYDQETGLGYCVYCKSTSLKPLGDGIHAADLIAQELDRRCEGIAIDENGHAHFEHTFKHIRSGKTCIAVGWNRPMGAKELHALLGWLLMKTQH